MFDNRSACSIYSLLFRKFANFDAQANVEPNYDLLYGNISTTGAVRSFYDPNAYPSKECSQDKRPDTSGDSIDDYNDEPPLLEGKLYKSRNRIYIQTLSRRKCIYRVGNKSKSDFSKGKLYQY